MPWYDFQCRSCDHEFTEVLKMDDREKPTRKKCPDCGKKTVSKLIGNVLMADPVNLGRTRPDETYREVLSKINAEQKLKGTKYEIKDRMTRSS